MLKVPSQEYQIAQYIGKIVEIQGSTGRDTGQYRQKYRIVQVEVQDSTGRDTEQYSQVEIQGFKKEIQDSTVTDTSILARDGTLRLEHGTNIPK